MPARRSIGRLSLVAVLLTVLSLQSTVSGTVYNALDVRGITNSSSPGVVFQSGNAANATIYSNSTSAKATTPTTNYPTSYMILSGTYTSGTLPGSVNAQDSSFFITSSSSESLSSVQITPVTAADQTLLPSSQQHIIRNTRGQAAFYTFYRDTVSTVDRCRYAYSTDGVTWTKDVEIGLAAAFVSCSAVLREDSANARSVIYLAASKMQTVAAGGNDIVFVIGTIADSASAVSWGTVATARASGGNENQAYPSIAQAADGYLHIAFAWSKNAGSNDNQNVVVCSSQTANPTANPAWTCSDGTTNNPFTTETTTDLEQLIGMPQIVPMLSGNDVLVIKGDCGSTQTVGCNTGTDSVERSRVLDWNGATQTWGNSASFTPTTGSPADERSATVNATSGRVHLVYEDGGSNVLSRYMDSPYNSWSSTSTVFSGTVDGVHASLSFGGSVKKVFVFYIKNSNGDVFSKNATDSQSWSAEQTEYTNSTTAGKWIASQMLVNSTAYSFVPTLWRQAAATPELWFRGHGMFLAASTQFTFAVSSSTTPSQLNFTIIHQYTVASATVRLQVWNFTSANWAGTSEAGFLLYTSSATPSTDESKSLVVTSGMASYVSSGTVRLRVRGVFDTSFQQKSNLVRLFYYQQTYDYVLRIVNNQATAYSIRLNAQGLTQSNLVRLSNFTAWFYGGAQSVQLQVLSGSLTIQTGGLYNLGASSTVYMAIRVSGTPGVSTVDSYLQVYTPSTTAHVDYRLTFVVT